MARRALDTCRARDRRVLARVARHLPRCARARAAAKRASKNKGGHGGLSSRGRGTISSGLSRGDRREGRHRATPAGGEGRAEAVAAHDICGDHRQQGLARSGTAPSGAARVGRSQYRTAALVASQPYAWAAAPYGRRALRSSRRKPLGRAARVGRPLVERIVAPTAVSIAGDAWQRLGRVGSVRAGTRLGTGPCSPGRTIPRRGLEVRGTVVCARDCATLYRPLRDRTVTLTSKSIARSRARTRSVTANGRAPGYVGRREGHQRRPALKRLDSTVIAERPRGAGRQAPHTPPPHGSFDEPRGEAIYTTSSASGTSRARRSLWSYPTRNAEARCPSGGLRFDARSSTRSRQDALPLARTPLVALSGRCHAMSRTTSMPQPCATESPRRPVRRRPRRGRLLRHEVTRSRSCLDEPGEAEEHVGQEFS